MHLSIETIQYRYFMLQCNSPPDRFSLHPLGLARRIPRGPAHGAAIGDEFRLHFARPCPACGSGPRHLRSFPSRDRPSAMQIRNDIVEAIGNTPLIKLKHASERTGCTILGKAEFMNPGQSVKDRAALFIIEDAVDRKSTRLNSSHSQISYAVFCLKKKKINPYPASAHT